MMAVAYTKPWDAAVEKNVRDFWDLSHERESSEQFVWYGETETQLRRGAIMPSIEPIGVKMK
jgi:hypothetical protein